MRNSRKRGRTPARPNELQIDPGRWEPWAEVLPEVEEIYGQGCIRLDAAGKVPFDDGSDPAVRFLTAVAQTHDRRGRRLPAAAPFVLASAIKYLWRLYDGASDAQMLRWIRFLQDNRGDLLVEPSRNSLGADPLSLVAGHACMRIGRLRFGEYQWLPSRRIERIANDEAAERNDRYYVRHGREYDTDDPGGYLSSIGSGACLILGPTTHMYAPSGPGCVRPYSVHRARRYEILAELALRHDWAERTCDQWRGAGYFTRLPVEQQISRALGQDAIEDYRDIMQTPAASTPDRRVCRSSWPAWDEALALLAELFHAPEPLGPLEDGGVVLRPSDPAPLALFEILTQPRVTPPLALVILRTIRHFVRLRGDRADYRVLLYALHLGRELALAATKSEMNWPAANLAAYARLHLARRGAIPVFGFTEICSRQIERLWPGDLAEFYNAIPDAPMTCLDSLPDGAIARGPRSR